MLSPLFTVTNQVTIPSTQNIDSVKMNNISENDLARVDWITNVAPNGDLEDWSSSTSPNNIYTTRSIEQSSWIETSIVNEGVQSVGMKGRALDANHYAEVRLTQDNWTYWDNPINTTLSLDWYLDEIGNPNDVDYFRIQVQMSGRNMYYYLGCDTSYTNSSTAYFNIDGPLDTWNKLQRNITRDYIEVFSQIPTRFELVYMWIRTYTNEYVQVYVDDFTIMNGTDVRVGGTHNNGDFEGGGGWSFSGSTDPADISQSSTAHAGDWSMNMTAISYDYSAKATARFNIDKRLTSTDKGELSFYWNISDWVNPSMFTIAYVRASVSNTTTSTNMYYYLCVGGTGTLPPVGMGNDMKFKADDFNVTNDWNFFDHNIWDDFNTMSTTDELWLESFTITVVANEDDSRLSILFDDINFTASIVNDMGYETQGAIGTPIEGWTEPISDPEFSVTDFAHSGNRAGNITLEDYNYLEYEQRLGTLPIDNTTELILDFNVYIDTFNESSEDFIFFEVGFDGADLAFVIANSSSEVESWIGGEENDIVLLQNNIVTGEWLNFQIDLAHIYESHFGTTPNTTLEKLGMTAYSGSDSKLVVFVDDLYIYYDVAPEITSIDQSPTTVDEAGEIVSISAEVVDGSEVTVTLSYRVDSGAWINLTLDETTNGNYTVDINAPYGVTEYFITAVDAFGKTDTAMDGGSYITFTTVDTIDPVITLTPANGSTVSDIVSIEIEVTDAGSGFAGAELFIEGSSITNVTLDTIGITWDTTVIPDGDYSITVVAEDNAGNTATVTHVVTVENAAATTTGDLTGVILIAVIIAAVGIVLVIYIFVIKKK